MTFVSTKQRRKRWDDLKTKLEDLYARFNRRAYVHPDPLEFLYNYSDSADREIVGLIASSLAYGNVRQILKSVSLVLKPLDRSPRLFLEEKRPEEIRATFGKFKHRWHTGNDMGLMLIGVKRVLEKFGSLGACFRAGYHEGDPDVLPALECFVSEVTHGQEGLRKNLLPFPTRGSACKRLLMYLRWMIRKDEVDPGGWDGIPPSKLLVPVDTHMHRMARRLRFTKRKQANLATVREITAAFRKIVPEDPARYDFTLTRFGIRKDLKWSTV